MTQKIAVVGATGRVGEHVVDVLREQGPEPVEIARSLGVDVVTGEGLDEALAGVSVVIDCATGAVAGRGGGGRVLRGRGAHPDRGGREGGRDRAPWSCRSSASTSSPPATTPPSRSTSGRWLDGPIDARILRAAQFHEFVETMLGVGPPGRRRLRPGDAHAARRGPRGGRVARVPRADGRRRGRADLGGRRPAGGAAARGGAARRPRRRARRGGRGARRRRRRAVRSRARCCPARTPASRARRSPSGSPARRRST